MRTLVFNVKGQLIERDMSCNFGGLVAGTKGYLKARFNFSEDWVGCSKVVGFFSKVGGKEIEFAPCVLSNGNDCYIPKEALEYHVFNIRLYGKKNGVVITTRPISIKQYGGK